MSSFFVDKKLIDSTINAYIAIKKAGYSEVLRSLNESGIMFTAENAEQCDTFGKLLWSMNKDAVNTRYPHVASNYDLIIQNYKHHWNPKEPVMLTYKRLKCFHYQCLEDEVDDRILCKVTGFVKDILARMIVETLPEFDAIEWGE